MILIFDLDDTLYPEISYVKSGLREVSIFLSKDFGLNKEITYRDMCKFLNIHGRGKIFDSILQKNKIFTIKNVKKSISIYRNHVPKISLYRDAEHCIERFKNSKKYIITDGNIIVQRNKIKSLRLHKNFVKIIPTYQYGLSFSKPSLACFNMILEAEQVKPEGMVYIGDNPHKDFINLKKIGIKTIRINRGAFKDIKLDDEHEADYNFKNLNSITKKFIGSIYEDR